jgi:tetratricopeptide (TPR) repeat protein
LRLLAVVHRELGETAEERAVLEQAAQLDGDAVAEYLRLAELCAAEEDWHAVLAHAEAALAVNPLILAPHRYLADAAEHTGDDARALSGVTALLEMDPFDPAATHFRAAKLEQRLGNIPAAKRHLLKSLEEAPRYRDAQRLLLQLVEPAKEPAKEPTDADKPDATKPAATTPSSPAPAESPAKPSPQTVPPKATAP